MVEYRQKENRKQYYTIFNGKDTYSFTYIIFHHPPPPKFTQENIFWVLLKSERKPETRAIDTQRPSPGQDQNYGW